jgi:FkbM family methyltransferase
MTEYILNGIILEVPEDLQTQTIKRMLEKGWYEIEELRAIRAHLQVSDIVLELGGGLGYLSSFCAQTVAPEKVTTVEANPALVPIIKKTLSRNGANDATVLHGIALENPKSKKADFYISGAFWSGTNKQSIEVDEKATSIRVFPFSELLRKHEPTFIIMDIEGSEEDFFFAKLPNKLRVIVIELHPSRYSSTGIKGIFLRLSEQGFVYETMGSHGAIVVFRRECTNIL